MLTDLDWLGHNLNDKKYDDPEALRPKKNTKILRMLIFVARKKNTDK